MFSQSRASKGLTWNVGSTRRSGLLMRWKVSLLWRSDVEMNMTTDLDGADITGFCCKCDSAYSIIMEVSFYV